MDFPSTAYDEWLLPKDHFVCEECDCDEKTYKEDVCECACHQLGPEENYDPQNPQALVADAKYRGKI